MFVIPFRVSEELYSVCIVLLDDNLVRIKGYDPAELVLKSLGPPWTGYKLKDVVITYATEAEQAEVIRLCHAGRPRDALRLLTRGWEFRPDRGDYDGPPLSAKTEPEKKAQ